MKVLIMAVPTDCIDESVYDGSGDSATGGHDDESRDSATGNVIMKVMILERNKW